MKARLDLVLKRGKRQIHDEVKARVEWWIRDMCFKAPEQLTDHYYDTMAEDIANIAVGKPPVAHRRLDPPR